jgi:hypothetical protein
VRLRSLNLANRGEVFMVVVNIMEGFMKYYIVDALSKTIEGEFESEGEMLKHFSGLILLRDAFKYLELYPAGHVFNLEREIYDLKHELLKYQGEK